MPYPWSFLPNFCRLSLVSAEEMTVSSSLWACSHRSVSLSPGLTTKDPTTQSIPVSGVLVKAQEGPLRLLTHEQARRLLGVESHRITYRDVLNLRRIGDQQAEVTHNQAKQALHDTVRRVQGGL